MGKGKGRGLTRFDHLPVRIAGTSQHESDGFGAMTLRPRGCGGRHGRGDRDQAAQRQTDVAWERKLM
jgi:hypothetical protein